MLKTIDSSSVELTEATVQRSVSRPIEFKGIALHTGSKAAVIVKPTYKQEILFSDGIQKNHNQFLYCGDNTSSVAFGANKVGCIEHLMSALHGLGITNAEIQILYGDECPFADGSSHTFVSAIMSAGILLSRKPANCIRVKKAFQFGNPTSGQFLTAEPSDHFEVDATIEFPGTIVGKQQRRIVVTQASYINEISMARTFLRESVSAIDLNCARRTRLKGLPNGEAADSPVIIYSDTDYLTNLRYSDEPVRHKLLDFIGDIYTTGLPVLGKFVVVRPGHEFNLRFANELRRTLSLP